MTFFESDLVDNDIYNYLLEITDHFVVPHKLQNIYDQAKLVVSPALICSIDRSELKEKWPSVIWPNLDDNPAFLFYRDIADIPKRKRKFYHLFISLTIYVERDAEICLSQVCRDFLARLSENISLKLYQPILVGYVSSDIITGNISANDRWDIASVNIDICVTDIP